MFVGHYGVSFAAKKAEPGVPLWVLFIVRVGSSFGETVNGPIHGGLIGDFYSPKARVKAFGLHYLANPGGAADVSSCDAT